MAVPTAAFAAGANGLMNTAGMIMQIEAEREAQREAQKGAKSASKQMEQGWNEASGAFDQNQADIDAFKAQFGSLYGNADDINSITEKYRNLLNGDLPNPYKAGDFDYNKDINDFYDKAYKVNIQDQTDALARSAANAGNLYSSGLNAQTQAKASANALNAYKEARDAFFKDKTMETDIWKAKEANAQAEATQALERYKTQLESLSDYINSAIGYNEDILSVQINNRNSKTNAYTEALSAYTDLLAQAGGTSGTGLPYNNGTGTLPNY